MPNTAGDAEEARARDSHGRFTKTSLEVGHGADLVGEEYKAELERAKALREVQKKEEEEAEIMRVQYCDADIPTLLTVAMMAKFTLTWGDKPLLCSGDADALARLPDILVWLEAAIPRARNLAPLMFNLAAYVDWRIRHDTCPLLVVECPEDVFC